MSQSDKSPSRWHALMTKLLYPAILGALMYEAFDKLVVSFPKIPSDQYAAVLLVVVLLVLYVFDFIYTDVDGESYDGRNFLCDLFIIALLYFSIKVAFVHIEMPVEAACVAVEACARNLKSVLVDYYFLLSPAIWLFFIKLVSVVWEFSERKKEKPHAPKEFDLNTDLAAGVVYFLVYPLTIMPGTVLPGTISTMILVAAVCLDIWWYYEDTIKRDEMRQDATHTQQT